MVFSSKTWAKKRNPCTTEMGSLRHAAPCRSCPSLEEDLGFGLFCLCHSGAVQVQNIFHTRLSPHHTVETIQALHFEFPRACMNQAFSRRLYQARVAVVQFNVCKKNFEGSSWSFACGSEISGGCSNNISYYITITWTLCLGKIKTIEA